MIAVLVLFFTIFIVYNIFYPNKEVTFQASQTIKDDSYFKDYSVLVDKEDNHFIGVGNFIPPDSLTTLISKQENLDLLEWEKYEIYDDIELSVDGVKVHVQVIEKRRMIFEKVYHAHISVLYEGYYIQEKIYWDLDEKEVDFTNEQQVKDAAINRGREIIEKYGENIHRLDKYFP